MRFLITASILLVFVSKIFSQDTINKIYFQNGNLKCVQLKIDSVLAYEKIYYENMQVRGEGTGFIRKGKFIAGNFKSYYESGELWYEINDSLNLNYKKDGQLYMKIQLAKGEKNGFMEYYLKGVLWLKTEYKNDLKDGKQIIYAKDGRKIRSQEEYKKGKMQGPAKYYGEDGKLEKELYYADDCIIKVLYYKKGKNVKILLNKKEILLAEGKSLDCKL